MLRKLNLLIQLKSNHTRWMSSKAAKRLPIITCKNQELNLYLDDKPKKPEDIVLASKGWQHYKSKGDFFTIHPQRDVLESNFKDATSIDDIDVNEQIVKNAKEKHSIEKVTKLQKNVVDLALQEKHVLIAAQTGCGKTHAYLMPIIEQIRRFKEREHIDRQFNTPLALIITPGRELAEQIANFARDLCDGLDINVKSVKGGNTKRLMMNPSYEDVDILVGSMGAISKLTTCGIYRMSEIRHVVLDEADTLMDDSFTEKLSYYLQRFKFYKDVQLILASATMPTNVEETFRDIIDTSTLNSVASDDLHKILPYVTQKFLRMNKMDRPEHLLKIVKSEVAKKRPVIVFSNKSVSSDFVEIFLSKNGVNSVCVNGDMLMKIREGKFQQFQDGQVNVISTTDCIGRGLNTTRARHIINFEFPFQIADYIHRCGRIGRLGSDQHCTVTNFVSGIADLDLVRKIELSARTDNMLKNVDANVTRIIHGKMERELEKLQRQEMQQLNQQ